MGCKVTRSDHARPRGCRPRAIKAEKKTFNPMKNEGLSLRGKGGFHCERRGTSRRKNCLTSSH